MGLTKSERNQKRRALDWLEFIERIPKIHPQLIKHFGQAHYDQQLVHAQGDYNQWI